jgi:calcineurin-like phosphoesterase family protein
MRGLILVGFLIARAETPAAALQDPPVAGAVFLDRNANGVRDAGEPGLARIPVSDQVSVVLTDPTGSFELPARGGYGFVFVSVPNGLRPIGRFWRRMDENALVFPLAPERSPREFRFLHASDTHLDSLSLPRTRHLVHLVDSLRPAFVLITGDLIRDALRVSETVATAQYELFLREMTRLPSRLWTVPGNHEIFGIERRLSQVDPQHPLYAKAMYRHYLGPDYYSFNYGGVHFVGLNSVDYDDQWYYGHVDDVQRSWLEQDLSFVPAATPVVTFNHIPFFSAAEIIHGFREEPPAPTLIRVAGATVFRHVVSNAGEVVSVVRRHPYPLALGGHMHMRETLEYGLAGSATRFEQAAAVLGPSDGAGLVFQSGVTLYEVRGGVIGVGKFIPVSE